MSAAPEIDAAVATPQEAAAVELVQRLLGWQIKGAQGVPEIVAAELRTDAARFPHPYDRLQLAIFRELDAGRTISIKTVYAQMQDDPGLAEIGGAEHLWVLAHSAPATASEEDCKKQARAAIRTWRHLQVQLPRAGDAELIPADAIVPVKIDWIWPGWLAAGKFHLIAGSPGTGKTTLSLAIAAAITTGGQFPCGWQASRGSVLMWTGEDDLADSIVPRFMACGGDPSRLHFVDGIRDADGGIVPFDPASDIEALTRAASRLPDLRLLIVDPVVSAVAGDSHKNGETRRSLQPLVDFAAQAGVAVLGVTHYSKGTAGQDPAERVTGSLAFVAVSRLVMATAKPKHPGDSWRLVRAKSNIGPDGGGFEYDLQRITVDPDRDVQGQCVVWGEALEGTAQALLAEVESPEQEPDAPGRTAAEEWLRNILGTGTVRASYIGQAAQDAGLSMRTIHRAKKRLGVESVNGGKSGWLWSLNQVAKLDCHSEEVGNVATLPDCQANCVATLVGNVVGPRTNIEEQMGAEVSE